MKGIFRISFLLLLCFVIESNQNPRTTSKKKSKKRDFGPKEFNFGSLLTNSVGAAFNTALGRDCKGRPQGSYFYGCQCVGPFNIGRRKRSPQNKLFINSNQGVG